MRKTVYLLALASAVSWTGALAQSDTGQPDADTTEGNLYLGFGVKSLGLDNDRIPGVPTSSPGHASKIASGILGYQFNDAWGVDISVGTAFEETDVDVFAINGYRYFGSSNWRPFVSAGLSSFSIDDAPDDDSQQAQAGFGIAGNLNRNLQVRAGYQYHVTINDEDFEDNAVGVQLLWHFREPEAVAVSEPEPEPEPAPAPQEVVEEITMRVLFDFDKSTIREAYEPQFQDVADTVLGNPEINMTIEGHTDSIGTVQYNEGLAKRRADAVRDKFVNDYGIDPSRITTEGYGETQPVADNATADGRQQNRRAITIILGPAETME